MFFQGKYTESAAAARNALEKKHELGDIVGMADRLEALAMLALQQQRCERTAWLMGAANALWGRVGRRLGGAAIMDQLHQQAVKAARDALGEDCYAALFRNGADHPLDLVVKLAVTDADEPQGGAGQPAGSADRPGTADRGAGRGGMSNRDIAQRSAISKRTVDAHLEHIFGKLGISSRVQLTTWLSSARPVS